VQSPSSAKVKDSPCKPAELRTISSTNRFFDKGRKQKVHAALAKLFRKDIKKALYSREVINIDNELYDRINFILRCVWNPPGTIS
jgi:hypothetical protein